MAEPVSDFETLAQRKLRPQTLSRNANQAFDERLTFGERLADQVATFGGSWSFIVGFGCFLLLWTGSNLILARAAADPYPFIFLNLILSMLAAIQAPIIMMSQNRQAAKDRAVAAHDYEVNLKAELEIMALHDKLDQLRTQEMEGLLRKQQEQVDLLARLLKSQPNAELWAEPSPATALPDVRAAILQAGMAGAGGQCVPPIQPADMGPQEGVEDAARRRRLEKPKAD